MKFSTLYYTSKRPRVK